MKDENYIVIQGWMINNLKLKGNELTIYALIYGYSQNGENTYKGSLQKVSEDTNISRQSCLNVLNKLIEKKLVYKRF